MIERFPPLPFPSKFPRAEKKNRRSYFENISNNQVPVIDITIYHSLPGIISLQPGCSQVGYIYIKKINIERDKSTIFGCSFR